MSVNYPQNVPSTFKTFQNSQVKSSEPAKSADSPVLDEPLKSDVFKVTKKGKTKVNVLRIWFSRLKQEQIDEINKTKTVPDNMRIDPCAIGTGFHIRHNIFGLIQGSTNLPDGWEVKRNILGFTRIVPEGTQGFWIGRKKEPKADTQV